MGGIQLQYHKLSPNLKSNSKNLNLGLFILLNVKSLSQVKVIITKEELKRENIKIKEEKLDFKLMNYFISTCPE